MDVFILIIALIIVIVGILGTILPALPGVPLAFFGLLIYKFSDCCSYSWTWVLIMGVITLLVAFLDYYIPIYGTKKTGGSKYGMYGSILGMLIGLFAFPPFGFIIGAMIGAFVGELIKNKDNVKGAFRAALGSFIGFMLSIGIGLFVSISMLVLILTHISCKLN